MIALDPLEADVVEDDRRAEGEPGEDRHLRRGVGPVHVLGRVGLGVAELLGARQHLVVGGAGLRHLGEDEVGRPVDDPEDLLDLGRGKALLDHPDHGNDARHRRLEADLDPGLARCAEELVAVLGDQLLVGGDDVLARRAAPAARSPAPGRCRRSARRRCRCRRGSRRSRPRSGAGRRRPRVAARSTPRSRRRGRRSGRAARRRRSPGPAAPIRTGHHSSRPSRSSQVSRRTTTRASPSEQKITGGRGTPL